ncbi:hypothetical protein MTYM_02008 [Methylococcales bacterium]|nr:hypothetical protein MTYM_02008 [Methylococcales bacterium]
MIGRVLRIYSPVVVRKMDNGQVRTLAPPPSGVQVLNGQSQGTRPHCPFNPFLSVVLSLQLSRKRFCQHAWHQRVDFFFLLDVPLAQLIHTLFYFSEAYLSFHSR